MRIVWVIAFWVWSVLGLIFNAIQVVVAHNMRELGVGTSAAIMMDTMLWIGGSLVFGLGASLTKEDTVRRPTAPPTARHPTAPPAQQAVSPALDRTDRGVTAEDIAAEDAPLERALKVIILTAVVVLIAAIGVLLALRR
jgi:hypothetical protein